MGFHANLTDSDIHVPYRWVWADSTERNAETVTATDVGKIGIQVDTYAVYYLVDTVPTWELIGGAGTTTLAGLTDTNISSPTNGQHLIYNSVGGYWENQTVTDDNSHTVNDAVTAAITDVVTLTHTSTGTVAAGFGTGINVIAEDAGGSNVNIGKIEWGWSNPVVGFNQLSRVSIRSAGAGGIASVANFAGTRYWDTEPGAMGDGARDFQSSRTATSQTATNYNSTILGGSQSTNNGVCSTIINGYQNVITTGNYNMVATGRENSIYAGDGNFISGSNNNIADGQSNTVVGKNNQLLNTAYYGLVVGENNELGYGGGVYHGRVGGANNRLIFGNYGVILNGNANYVASNEYCSVLNGTNNVIVTTKHATVINGDRAIANKQGQVVANSGVFTGTGDAQGTIQITPFRQVTHSDANWYPLYLDGSSALIPISQEGLWTIHALVVGATLDLAKTWSYEILGAVTNIAGTVTVLNFTVNVVSETTSTFDVRLSPDNPNEHINIEVQDSGAGGDTVRWVASVRTAELIYT